RLGGGSDDGNGVVAPGAVFLTTAFDDPGACVFTADVEATEAGDVVVDDQEFAVGTGGGAPGIIAFPRADGGELHHSDTRAAHAIAQRGLGAVDLRGAAGAKGVVDDISSNA